MAARWGEGQGYYLPKILDEALPHIGSGAYTLSVGAAVFCSLIPILSALSSVLLGIAFLAFGTKKKIVSVVQHRMSQRLEESSQIEENIYQHPFGYFLAIGSSDEIRKYKKISNARIFRDQGAKGFQT